MKPIKAIIDREETVANHKNDYYFEGTECEILSFTKCCIFQLSDGNFEEEDTDADQIIACLVVKIENEIHYVQNQNITIIDD